MGNSYENFENFLNTGWGKKATKYLKEGATFKILIDEKPFSLSKREGKMTMSPGTPANYVVLLEMSSSGIEYLCDAKTEDEAQERLGQLIHSPIPERYARMKVEVEPTEKGRLDFYWNGFVFWARRMRFVD
jgi:hypothetical protein